MFFISRYIIIFLFSKHYKKTRTALITGTSSGLGKSLTDFFADNNWYVIATSRNPKGSWKNNKNVLEIQLDLSDREKMQRILESVFEKVKQIDLIVNNAGKAIMGSLENTTEESIKEVFDVNVLGAIRMIQIAISCFRKQGYGKIINISSLIGLSVDIPLASIYAMSKFAVEGLTEGLYYELKAQNIDIHLVEPGGFKSSLGINALFFPSKKDSVYAEINEHLDAYLDSKSTDINSPHTNIEDVVSTVYKLATGEINSFRNPVGRDSEEILNLRSNKSIEEYLKIVSNRFIK